MVYFFFPVWQSEHLPPFLGGLGEGFMGGRLIMSVTFWPVAGCYAMDCTEDKTNNGQKKEAGYPGPLEYRV